ncbi:MAG: Flp family type IVb pilin [Acidimicrobiia bacterium]|nr:Flp family type IVb pilin [Acidimicrobiia bacterium]
MLRLLTNEDGANLIEYGILVVLIAIVALLAVQSVGQETSSMFADIHTGFP